MVVAVVQDEELMAVGGYCTTMVGWGRSIVIIIVVVVLVVAVVIIIIIKIIKIIFINNTSACPSFQDLKIHFSKPRWTYSNLQKL